MRTQLASHRGPDQQRVLREAARRAAVKLGLTMKDVADIIGVRRESMSRVDSALSPKQFELCVLFVRAARSLSAILGQDDRNMAHWVRSENRALGGAPVTLMKSVAGLVRTVEYLDASRAKI